MASTFQVLVRFACVLVVLAVALAQLALPAGAAEEVDLQLILMVDASGSIDEREFALQRLGYARAFKNPRVVNAIRSGALGRIAVAYAEWTGPALQTMVIGWTLLDDERSAHAFAAELERRPRALYSGGTAVGSAILYGAAAIEARPFTAVRRVIDVSGDGATNRGPPAALAHDQVVARGFTVNGLPILTDDPFLDRYYETDVIGGPGAFSIPAKDFETFAAAILAKLVREIASVAPAPP
jgi:hypothetical protein